MDAALMRALGLVARVPHSENDEDPVPVTFEDEFRLTSRAIRW